MSEYCLDTSLAVNTWATLDRFTQGYIETAMWLLTDDDGNSLDYFGLHDIADETITAVKADCARFQELDSIAVLLDCESGTPEQNGHDYFLTRNHHGAGFWDRGYPSAVGKVLTDAAHAEGSDDWYVGDDGKVYRS